MGAEICGAVLVVPGSSERMLAKARNVEVAEVVLDLEDAVSVQQKAAALELVCRSLKTGFAARRVSVRVNPPRTPWCHRELAALAQAETAPDSIVLPKTDSAGDLAFVERLLDGLEAERGPGRSLGVQALIETAGGLARVREIAGASPRLQALVLGYADLAVSIGRPMRGEFAPGLWLAAQESVVVAARAAGLAAIDGPFLGLDDPDGLAAAARHAATVGFDGKWAIHPGQLQAIQDALRPSEQEVAQAREVLAALRESSGAGAIRHAGQMIDEPVRLAALRTLARAGVQDS
jgi:citrate lyase subunit beta/citryl-CoA lyase